MVNKVVVAWVIYILLGVVMPFIAIAIVVTPTESVISIANVSVLGLGLLMHHSMFSIISPCSHPKHTLVRLCIPSASVAVLCALLYGVPVYRVGDEPIPPNLETGECQPLTSVLGTCTSIKYYKTIETEAVAEFNSTIYTGELRDAALLNGIYQVGYLYGFLLTGMGESNQSTDFANMLQATCKPLWERYACVFMFPPCTGDCKPHRIPICRSLCTDYLKSCEHASRIYDFLGPESSLRPLVMPPNDNLNPVYFALDRALLYLKQGCGAETTASTGTGDGQCGSESFLPTSSGNCNEATRQTLASEYKEAVSNHDADIRSVERQRDKLHKALYGVVLVMFVLNVIYLWIHTVCVVRPARETRHGVEHAVGFWRRWVSVYPTVVTGALLVQGATIVVVQLAAREAERYGVYYVAVFEYVMCILEFNVMLDTLLCFVRISEELEQNTPKELIPWAPAPIRRLYNNVSIYGNGFAARVLVQEMLEVAVQFSYFFVAVSSTDSFTMLASCAVLSLNLCVTPYSLYMDRIYTVLFDVVVEVFYLLFNFFTTYGNSDQWQQRSVLENVIQCASLILATLGCVLALRSLSQYYFRLRDMYATLMVVVPESGQDESKDKNGDAVHPVVPNAVDHDEDLPSEQTESRTTTFHLNTSSADVDTRGPASPSVMKARFFRPVLRGSVWRRVLLSIPFVFVGLVFFLTTTIRVGLQNEACRDESGSLLWDRTFPKLLFKNGFLAPTQCHYEVMKVFDLSYLGLSDVPSSLQLFTSVRELNLTGNVIRTVDATLASLPLVNLGLSDNRIDWISPHVMEIASLTTVDVRNNKIETVLDWSHQGLRSVPRGLRFFPLLSSLNVSFNNLTSVDDLEVIPTLMLDFSHNNIVYVTKNRVIGGSVHVNASHNRLVSEYSLSTTTIYNEASQYSLDLSYNNLTDVPTLGFYRNVLRVMENITNYTFRLVGNPIAAFRPSELPFVYRTFDLPVFADLRDVLEEVDMSVTLASDGSIPRQLFGAPNLKLLNLSDIVWGSGAPLVKLSQKYNFIWMWITSFPQLRTLDLSTSTFDCLHYPEPRPYWTFSLGATSPIRKLVVRMAQPGGFLGPTFPSAFGSVLQELDMCLYNGTSLPAALQRFPNLLRLSMDRSVFDPTMVMVEDVVRVATSTPLLEELSVTGVFGISTEGLTAALPLWRGLRVLYIGDTNLTVLPILPSLRVLDAADSHQLQWSQPHPIRMYSLRCLVAGTSLDFDPTDAFPTLEYLDLRHVRSKSSVYEVDSRVVFPRLRRVCVLSNEFSACRVWTSRGINNSSTTTTGIECVAGDVCRNDVNVCGLPKYPTQPPARTWGNVVVSSIPAETAHCPLCRSACYHDSVVGNTPPPKPIDVDETHFNF